VKRDGQKMEILMKFGSCEYTAYSLTEMGGATPQQQKIREGWLKR